MTSNWSFSPSFSNDTVYCRSFAYAIELMVLEPGAGVSTVLPPSR